MSSALLSLAFREPKNQKPKMVLLLDDLDEKERQEHEQKIKASQFGIEIKPPRYLDYLKKQAERGRIRYRNNPEIKEKSRIKSAKFRRENPRRAFEISKAWRKRNPETVRKLNRAYYWRRKASMTPDEYKLWQREKNKQAKERKIAKIGIEAYRAAERERLKRYYANNPDAVKRNREKNKEAMRLRRQQQKEKQA